MRKFIAAGAVVFIALAIMFAGCNSSVDDDIPVNPVVKQGAVEDLVRSMEEITSNYRFKDFTSSIGAIAGGIISDNLAFGNVVTAITSLLSITGIMDGRTPQEKRLDEILDIVKDIDQRLRAFIGDFELFKQLVDKQFERIDKNLGKIEYNQYQTLWNNYRDAYITTAGTILSEFQSSSRLTLMDYIINASSGTITATFDSDSPIFPGQTLVIPVGAASFNNSRSKLGDISNPVYSDEFAQTINSDLSVMITAEVAAGRINLGTVKVSDVVPYFLSAIMKDVYGKVLNKQLESGATYANYIINQYNEFVKGTLSGATASPLVTYYNLIKVFYNFDDECAESLKNGYEYIMLLNLQFASVAMTAAEFDSTSTEKADNLVKTFVSVKDDLKKVKLANDHSGDKTFSNVTNCKITIRNVQSVSSLYCAYKGGYKYLEEETRDNGWKFYDVVNNYEEFDISKDPILDEMDAKKIVGLAFAYREHTYKGMYPGKDTEFLIKYFSNHFVLDKEDTCCSKFLLTKPVKEVIGNGDMTLRCNWKFLYRGSYFNPDDSYVIGDSGDRSYEYFVIKDCLRSNYFNLYTEDGSLKYLYNSRYMARAFYGESHGYWLNTDESAYLTGSDDGSLQYWDIDRCEKEDYIARNESYAFYLMRVN